MHKHVEFSKAFADLGVEPRFLRALAKMQFETPSQIQERMIPHALNGRDILGQARTGTGKTAAFGLPVLQQLDSGQRLQALCLVPTRELAVQVSAELRRLAEFSDLHVVSVYGGQKVAVQLHQLGRKPHFVVGTPGRVWDFMQRGVLNFERVRFVILDEVDRMLDIGFREDIKTILGRVTGPHQTMFVSATIDEEISRLSKRYMTNPIDVNVSHDKMTVDEVDQTYVTVDRHDKFRMLHRLIEIEDPPVTIVFCNTKAAARKLTKRLHSAGLNVQEIHGDLDQRKRDRVMDRFRKHQIKVLVATDLAARGIDVSAISHIINYDIPPDSHVYVHRIGRTARMGAKGVAITLVSPSEGKELTNIEKLINREIPMRPVRGFVPSRPREEAATPVVSAPPSRLTAPALSPDGDSHPKPPPKTLGGRFRPARGRRR